MIVTIEVPGERIILDDKSLTARCVNIDRSGHPFGYVREGTIRRLLDEVTAEQNRRATLTAEGR
jgi:hypothetical protein